MALLYLLTLSLIAQATLQEPTEWNNERMVFMNTAGNFFINRLAPFRVRRLRLSEYDKCSHQNGSPYGIGRFTLQVSCPQGDLVYCGLYDTPTDTHGKKMVDCQFAAEITQYGSGRVLAALCYQNPITDTWKSREQIRGGEMCKKWAYPGTQLPQLQLPQYLKSLDTMLLWYETANLESFNGYNSRSREVATTRWIRNKYERTGFSGKGKLPEYGPNKALYLLITSYSSGTTKFIVEDTDNYIALPRFWVKKATIDADIIKRKVQKLNHYCNQSEINVMVQTRQNYHDGYLKNRQNTDNAWLEGAIIHLHDNSDRGCFGPDPVHSKVPTRRYRWRVLPHTTTPRDFARIFGISLK